MSRPRKEPSYLKHTGADGRVRARVVIDGKTHYLGEWNSVESLERYHAKLAEWRARHGLQQAVPVAGVRTVADLAALFLLHADRHYRWPDGTAKGELEKFRALAVPLCRLHGATPVTNFGPKALRDFQRALADGSWKTDAERASRLRRGFPVGWCRSNVNRSVVRVRTAWAWAEAEELIPPSSLHALKTVRGLRHGEAREAEDVLPVPEADLAATLPQLGRVVRGLVEFQLLTGCRPGEAVIARPLDFERADRVEVAPGHWLETKGRAWVYRPGSDAGQYGAHKNAWRGKRRLILVGPRAQHVLTPFLDRAPDAYLFSPLEQSVEALTDAGRSVALRASRKPGSRYRVSSYGHSVAYACRRAFPPPIALKRIQDAAERKRQLREWHREHRWSPGQLRHNAASRVAAEFSTEIARIVLGHETVQTTLLYVLRDLQSALDAVGKVG